MKLPNGRAIVIMGMLFAGGSAFAQVRGAEGGGKSVDVKSQKSRGEGKDENIKDQGSTKNEAKKQVAPPPSKGGAKSRGISCDVLLDNRTPWKIQIFVDGSYHGLLYSWDDARTYAIAGATKLYGKADFDDGSVRTWGPTLIECPADGVFTWHLYP